MIPVCGETQEQQRCCTLGEIQDNDEQDLRCIQGLDGWLEGAMRDLAYLPSMRFQHPSD